jgi:hypothetical protein
VRHVHFEPWFARSAEPPAAAWGRLDRDQALSGLAETLGSLARFVHAEEIAVVRVSPAALGAPLRRALAAQPEAATTAAATGSNGRPAKTKSRAPGRARALQD